MPFKLVAACLAALSLGGCFVPDVPLDNKACDRAHACEAGYACVEASDAGFVCVSLGSSGH